jgi:ATP-dependent Clp endopeptidase proteolytic subunit ClpP
LESAVNPFLRNPSAHQRTPLRAESPAPKTSDGGVVTLRLYDPLDSYGEEWGVSAKEFTATLDALPEDTTEIRLLINSPGGEVWQGLAILNALRSHPAKVIAVVEGIAASAASFIAAGADELHMMQNARLFVHRAWGGCIGNAVDMQKMAADLTHEDRNLASIYAGKSGGDVDDWLQVMTDETYYSAEEAVEVGLADRVVKPKRGSVDPVKDANNRFDLSVFARRPPNARVTVTDDDLDQAAVEPDDTTTPEHDPALVLPAAEPEQPTIPEPEEDPVSDLSEFRSRLGLDDTADEAAILAALDARLQSTDTQPTPTSEPDTEPTPAPAPAPAPAPEQTPKPTPAPQASEASDELRTELARVSAELAEIRAREAAAVKASVLDGAVKAGKIKPAERASWESRYDQAPAVITDVLNSIAAGTAVPVTPTGYTGSAEPSGDVDVPDDIAGLFSTPFSKEA